MTLEKSGFHVSRAKAFPDPDDPSVSREIDVHAYREIFRSDELSLSVGVRVLAECKQSTMPYVVVGGPASAYELGRNRKEQSFRFPAVETGSTSLGNGRARLYHTPAREYLGLEELPGNPWQSGFIGTQMTRLDRKKTWLADNRGIFTSLVYPLAKAVTHFHAQLPRSSYAMHRPGQEWAVIEFCYPVVVTSGSLFIVDASRPNMEAVETTWTTLTREIKSAKVDGQFNIDIVTYAALEDYVAQRIDTFTSAVAAVAKNDPQRFITHQDHSYERGQDQSG